MKKFWLSVAVAIFVLAGINQAKAQDVTEGATGACGACVGGVMFAAYGLGMVYIVARDIANGGLNRKYAEVVPGQGYRTDLMARLQNSPELVAVVTAWRRSEDYQYARADID